MVAMTQEGQPGEGGKECVQPRWPNSECPGQGLRVQPLQSVRRGFHQVGAGISPGSEAKGLSIQTETDGAGGWRGGAGVEMFPVFK